MNLLPFIKALISLSFITVLLTFSGVSSLIAQIGLTNEAQHAMVVSASEEASKIGLEIIKKGGNAVDAAVATHLALAVTFPQAGNIGGGGFMVFKPSGKPAVALDFRETAPASSSRDMYLNGDGEYQSQLSKIGPLAAGVPGSVAGLWAAHQRYGNLAWAELVQPAIKLAEEGFRLSYHEAYSLNNYQFRFAGYPSTQKIFSPKNDSLFYEGEHFIQADLAETLKRIASDGLDGFYKGKTSRLIAEFNAREGGLITANDLENYEPVWRTIIEAKFAGYTLHLMPPSSSGGVAVAQMLGMLDAQKLTEAGFLSADYLHQLAEAMRRAFADRATHLGDTDFYDVPIKGLIAPPYLASQWTSFNEEQASLSTEVGAGNPFQKESTETTHYSIIDTEGNAVAITTTLNGLYGNSMVVEGAGFFLNNEMDDFSSQPGVPNMFGLVGGEANSIAPGKRMLSSMTPTIVSDANGQVRMILGAAGGPRIINAVIQTFLAGALFDISAQKAIAAPRIHHQWLPDRLFIEQYSLGSDTRKLLRDKGHRLNEVSSIARSHLIFVTEEGIIQAGVDPRGRGASAGY